MWVKSAAGVVQASNASRRAMSSGARVTHDPFWRLALHEEVAVLGIEVQPVDAFEGCDLGQGSFPNGADPSNAWSTMPSSRSPNVMLCAEARALSTLRTRRSMRTPVCTRSISRRASSVSWFLSLSGWVGTLVPRYPTVNRLDER